MKKITQEQLINLIDTINGTTFVSIDIVSEPKMRKTGNPYLGTTKAVTLSGAINYDYQNSVNNQLEREDKDRDFTSQKRSWGEHTGNWITHKGQHYLPIKVQGASDPIYILEGNEIEKDKLAPFLYKSNKPHTQEKLEEEITVRDVKISSIRVIRIKNEELLVV